MLLNCGVGEDLRVPWTARRSNQSILKEISSEYSLQGWCWSWNSNTLATWWTESLEKTQSCWARLKTGGGEDSRWWDGWMVSPTQWIWVWEVPGSWWWTGKTGMLKSLLSQRVRRHWKTEVNWSWFTKKYLWIYLNHERCILIIEKHWFRISGKLSGSRFPFFTNELLLDSNTFLAYWFPAFFFFFFESSYYMP